MKHRHFTLLLAILQQTAQAGLVPIREHVDLVWTWNGNNWTCEAVTSTRTHDPSSVFLSMTDKPYVNGSASTSGSRFTQPASSSFDFTGAAAGAPLWIAVQGTPGAGEAWPGFDNKQPAGSLGAYIPSDPRVSQTTAREYIRISLAGYTPPPGVVSHFSMWTTSGSAPKVWMSTFDTSVVNDYYYTVGSHTHMNWGFTAPGVHKVKLTASAFLGPGATNPTDSSAVHEIVFAIGEFAKWQASWFDAAELADAAISGPGADPDGDGSNNLIEHAFGTDPRAGAAAGLTDGLGLPEFSITAEGGALYQTLVYPRRRAGTETSPTTYQPLFADSSAGPWTADGVTTTTTDFTGDQAALHASWEKVTARKPLGAGTVRGFARVVVGQ